MTDLQTKRPEAPAVADAPGATVDAPAAPTGQSGQSTQSTPDASGWAAPVARLRVGEMPRGSMRATVEGKRLAGPLQGFGQLWQKTFRVHLDRPELDPAGVVADWKAHFSEFWPKGTTFYAPLAGIQPGEVALLRITAAGPVKLNSGVMVIYADDTSFTLMTPEGHALAAWITFSAEQDAGGAIVAQAQALERTADPLGELAYRIRGEQGERPVLGADARGTRASFRRRDRM